MISLPRPFGRLETKKEIMERLMLKETLGAYQARQAAQRLFDAIRYQPPYSLVDADPYRSALLGAALACLVRDESQWWSVSVMPFEELFEVVREYADDAAEACQCPETAATFLMLVREAIYGKP